MALLRWRCPGVRTLRGDGGDRVGPGVAKKRKKLGTTNGAPDLTAHIYDPGKGPLQVERSRRRQAAGSGPTKFHGSRPSAPRAGKSSWCALLQRWIKQSTST